MPPSVFSAVSTSYRKAVRRGTLNQPLLGPLLVIAAGMISCGGGGGGSSEVPFAITSLTAAPSQVSFGESTRLTWDYSGSPSSLTLNGTPVTGKSITVSPVRRQVFTLSGRNGAGSETRSIKVAARGLDLLAGKPAGRGSADGTGAQAGFNYPRSIAVAASGNLYVADIDSHTIRKITPAGVVSTFAGLAGTAGTADGPGTSARFHTPTGLAVDASETLFVADYGNSTIRKVTSAGLVSTLAGSPGVSGHSDGPGTAARFSGPSGLALDPAGNLIVADKFNGLVRKIDPSGSVTTLQDQTGMPAPFNYPDSIAVDATGNVFVGSDYGYDTITRVTPAGVVSLLPDGSATGEPFRYPAGLAVDAPGNLYVADCVNSKIRVISPSGDIRTLAGSGSSSWADGTGTAARFNYPMGLAVDSAGTVFVADTSNHAIREITASAVVTTLAGSVAVPSASDGSGPSAGFNEPAGVASDASGNTYVADQGSSTIRKVTPEGVVSTLAGSPSALPGSTDGSGSAARFNHPASLAVDPSGNVFVADTGNHTIRKMTPAGEVTTVAGVAGSSGTSDGASGLSRFRLPAGVAVDTTGHVYVSDTNNHTIRKITPGGLVSTLAGQPRFPGTADGSGTSAQFNRPSGLAVDRQGNLFVADSWNYTIRMITPLGQVTTLAGSPGLSGSSDGIGDQARFNYPEALVLDAAGNLYVADRENHTIRKITPAGVVTTLAGTSGRPGFVPGAAMTTLVAPPSVAMTPDGDLVVPCNNALVQITAP